MPCWGIESWASYKLNYQISAPPAVCFLLVELFVLPCVLLFSFLHESRWPEWISLSSFFWTVKCTRPESSCAVFVCLLALSRRCLQGLLATVWVGCSLCCPAHLPSLPHPVLDPSPGSPRGLSPSLWTSIIHGDSWEVMRSPFVCDPIFASAPTTPITGEF